MAPNINNPGGVKNDPDEIRDGVVSDATRFPGGFIDQQITEAGAAVKIVGTFELTTASFAQSFDVSSQDGFTSGLAFKPDGNQMYTTGRVNDNVYQYALSTAFSVTTASFVRSFSVATQDVDPTGVAFNPDGSQLYVTGSENNNVYQYSLSTGFDISTASFVRSFNVDPQNVDPQGLAFKPDGSQLYVVGNKDVDVYQYSLSTAFDISTASFVRSFDVSPQDSSPRAIDLKPDGTRFYIVGGGNDNVYQYNLSTAFDISTASFARSFDVSPQHAGPKATTFSADGSRLYVSGSSANEVSEYVVGVIGGTGQ